MQDLPQHNVQFYVIYCLRHKLKAGPFSVSRQDKVVGGDLVDAGIRVVPVFGEGGNEGGRQTDRQTDR